MFRVDVLATIRHENGLLIAGEGHRIFQDYCWYVSAMSLSEDRNPKKVISMAKEKKQWVWAPAKPSKVPDALKREVSSKAESLVEDYLKPKHVEPPPKKPQFNYVVDLFTRWRGCFFYFMARYACPGPNRTAPFFEIGFARLEFVGDDRFDLAYFRHTGKWWSVYPGVNYTPKELSVQLILPL